MLSTFNTTHFPSVLFLSQQSQFHPYPDSLFVIAPLLVFSLTGYSSLRSGPPLGRETSSRFAYRLKLCFLFQTKAHPGTLFPPLDALQHQRHQNSCKLAGRSGECLIKFYILAFLKTPRAEIFGPVSVARTATPPQGVHVCP